MVIQEEWIGEKCIINRIKGFFEVSGYEFRVKVSSLVLVFFYSCSVVQVQVQGRQC